MVSIVSVFAPSILKSIEIDWLLVYPEKFLPNLISQLGPIAPKLFTGK